MLERLIAFLNLCINEFKHLVKRLSKKIVLDSVVGKHHLIYHWVENFTAEEDPRN